MAKDKLATKNTIGLTVACFGQCIFISLTSMALPMFFTDVLLIAPATVSVIFLVTRIWDAVNDPMMGMLVDKTRTKWGKCRPFLLFSSLPLFVFTVMMFIPLPPSATSNTKVGYYLAVYLLFITSYTALDIPVAGIKLLLFTSTDKRNKAMSISSTFSSLGSLLAIDLFFFFVQIIGGDNVKTGYFVTVLMLAFVGLFSLLVGFVSVKEVVPLPEKTATVFQTVKSISKNKYMLWIIVSTIFSIGISSFGIILPYFAKWNLADSFSFGKFNVETVMIPVLSTVTGVCFMISVFVTPYLLKWVTKRKLFYIMSIAGVILNIVSFLVGYKNLYAFMALRALAHIPPSITGTLVGFMFADTLDYGEYKNGERTEGMSYAINNFVNKTGNALFSSFMMFMLGVFGYNAAVTEPALMIGESTMRNYPGLLNGIFLLLTVLPAISLLFQMIPMYMYKFSDKSHEKVMEELNERRSQLVEEKQKDSTASQTMATEVKQ